MSRIDVEVAYHLLVFDDPFGIGRGGYLGIVGKAAPVEKPATDDLGDLGLG